METLTSSNIADPSVIVLILMHKERIDPYEVISMQQCFRILGHYPIKFICPRGLNVDHYLEINPQASFDFIAPHWQRTYMNHILLGNLIFYLIWLSV